MSDLRASLQVAAATFSDSTGEQQICGRQAKGAILNERPKGAVMATWRQNRLSNWQARPVSRQAETHTENGPTMEEIDYNLPRWVPH